MSTSDNNKRIAKNTAFLYFRMLLIMLVTLYTSRVVLAELGVVDFGLYNVIAGVVAMLGFLKSAMSLSVQRFLSFEMGRKNIKKLNVVFNVSLYAHVFLALIVFVLAETVGLWFVRTQLVIPLERVDAALFVYQCVVASSVLSVLEVPYNAVLLAAERFNIYAYVSIIEVVLKLAVAFLLTVTVFDKLEFYGFVIMAVTVFITSFYAVYAIRNFNYTRLCKVWDKGTLKNILGFSVWSLLGELSWVFVLQGINILINIFSGPMVNAARAISYQVNGAISSLTRSFQQALNPQIIKQYAAGNNEEMKSLLFRGTRFSYYLMLFFTSPLLLETDFILNLWLKDVPEHTVLFCQLVLIGGLLDGLSNLLATIAKAYGKIRNYQILVSVLLMLNFPISYILLKMGYFPEITMIVYLFVSVCLLLVRLYLTQRMIGLSPTEYFRKALVPILYVTLSTSGILLVVQTIEFAPVLRFFISCFSSVIVISFTTLFLGMTKGERNYVFTIIKNKLH